MPNILDINAEPFLEVFSFLGWVQKSHKHDHLVVIQGFQRFLFMISNGKVNDSHEVILNFIVKSWAHRSLPSQCCDIGKGPSPHLKNLLWRCQWDQVQLHYSWDARHNIYVHWWTGIFVQAIFSKTFWPTTLEPNNDWEQAIPHLKALYQVIFERCLK